MDNHQISVRSAHGEQKHSFPWSFGKPSAIRDICMLLGHKEPGMFTSLF